MHKVFREIHDDQEGQNLIEYEIFNSNKSKLKMHSNYYNARLDCWEPFVEKFNMAYISESLSGNNSFSELSIPCPLNINLSEEFVCTLSQLLGSASNDNSSPIQQRISKESTVSSNYKIVNMTSRRLIIKRNLRDYRKLIAEKLRNKNEEEKK